MSPKVPTTIPVERNYEYMSVLHVGTSPSGRTSRWVVADKHDNYLGQISWFGRWRQYTFFPEVGTVFSAGCLKDLQAFLDEVNKR